MMMVCKDDNDDNNTIPDIDQFDKHLPSVNDLDLQKIIEK